MSKNTMTSKEFRAMIDKGKQNKKRDNPEHRLQKACVEWFHLQYSKYKKLLFAIPNGAKLHGDETQRAIQWNILKAEGAEPGVSDLFLSIPSGELSGLYIEMKTPTGTQSKPQAEFEEAVLAVGYGYVIARTKEDFIAIVNSYLEFGTY